MSGDDALAAEEAPPSDAPTADQFVEAAHARALLEHAIDALPENFRMVFVLRVVEGLDVRETAECLEHQSRRRCARGCFARSASCASSCRSGCTAKARRSSISAPSAAIAWSSACSRVCRPRRAQSGASSSSGITGERLTVSSTIDEVTSRTPLHAQQAAHGEVRQRFDVAHDHVQQEIHLAGHRVAGEHFGPVDQRAPEALDDLVGVLLELDLHDGLDGLARAFRIDDGRVSLDESRRLELPDAPRAGRGREADALGEVGDADAPVPLQNIQDSSIGLVELHIWRI